MFSMRATSSESSNGFVTWSSAPVRSPCTRALRSSVREKDDWDEAILRDGLDDSAGIDPVQSRHVDVEHDEVDRLRADRVDRLLAVVGADDRQATRPKQLGYALARRAIVIGNDHHRLRKWTGSPHLHTIAEPGHIRESRSVEFP